MKGALSALVLLTASAASHAPIPQPAPHRDRPCRENPDLVGRCFTVHGALRFYNGGTPFHIWRIGTTRMLGVGAPSVARAGYCELPQWLQQRVSPDTEVIADFVVCPFTEERPGAERRVCVDTAYNVRVKARSS
jgi:hypothetical protein